MSIQYTADQLQRKFQGSPGSAGFSRLAEVLRTEGRIDEAIQVCQDGLRASPQTLSGYVVLGKALMDAGRMDDAREQFEAALRLDPRCLSAMHFLARIMTHLQWADAAAGYYRSILEVEPWDAEIRALLGEAAPATSYDPDVANAAAQDETFEKPNGFAGDVLEVNLNDVAADFLPSQGNEIMEPAEESLEDALSGASEERPHYSPAPIENIDTRQGQVEPQPKDILRDEPTGQMSAMGDEPPPISGQDVEDRLDSLFGSEETPSPSLTAQTSGWSPAPAETPAPELSPSDYSNVETDPSATATGEMRKVVDDVFPSATDLPRQTQDAEPFDAHDFSAVDFVTPVRVEDATETGEEDRVQGDDIEKRLDELFNLTESDSFVPAAETFAQATDPFASPEAGNAPMNAASLPMVRGPKAEEAVSLGEVVSFGGEVAYREADAAPSDAGTAEPKAEDFRFTPETTAPAQPEEEIVTGQDVADKLGNLFGEEPVSKSGPVTDAAAGNAATQAQAREEDEEASPYTTKPWRVDAIDGEHPMPPTGDIMSTESMLPPGWFGESEVSSGVPGASSGVVDASSGEPDASSGEPDASSGEPDASSGEPDASSGEGGYGPQITGADVEAQLDKLFHIEEDGETVKGAGAEKGNLGDTVFFQSPFGGLEERPAGAMPGDESDRTVLMPAMREPTAPKDTSRIKESVADWLARRSDDADQRTVNDSKAGGRIPPQAVLAPEAGETMILPAEDFNSTLELPSTSKYASPESPFARAFVDDPDSYGTLAPEDLSALSETTSIEMIDGEDVAGRLDELFSDEGTATVPSSRIETLDSGTEMSLFIQENGEALEMPELDADEGMVSGEDVSLRLHEIFEPGSATPDFPPAPTITTVPTGMETDEELLPNLGGPMTAGAATAGFSAPPTLSDPTLSDPTLSDPTLSDPTPTVPELAPMTDEEDGYPEEEDMPQSGAGANVATVTLAEIYFQQGLREQALQIYRQLLEREPENDSVRKRIEEIEATKPEGGDRDPGSDPRRPRPGLKVPKRKK